MNFRRIAPALLTGISVITSIAAVVMAVNETPRAIEVMDNHRLEIDPTGETDLAPLEKVKDYGKSYWKTEILIGVSVASSIAACIVSRNNYKALMASTAAISATYAKYKDKVKEVVGEEKAKLVTQKMKEDRHRDNDTACYDFYEPETGMIFKSSIHEMDLKYIDALHSIHCGSITLGEMYPELVRKDPTNKIFTKIWDQDSLFEGCGDDWLAMWYEHANYSADEAKEHQYPNINGGKECYIIHYNWPPEPYEFLYDR